MFKNSREHDEDERRSDRPSISTDKQRPRNQEFSNRRLTIRDIVELGISFGSCESILESNLGLRCIAFIFRAAKVTTSWTSFWVNRSDKKEFTARPEGYTGNRLPEMLRGLEKTLSNVLQCQRIILKKNNINLDE